MGDQRPGDNLYTSSVVAIDVATGALKSHFQYHQNDSWDWDEISAPLLIDYTAKGRKRRGLVTAARNGYLWWLEQLPQKIAFVAAQRFVRQNVFSSIDAQSGRPIVDEARKPGTDKVVEFCPGLWGGKNWPSAAFNPATRMLYVPANNNLCHVMGGVPNPVYTPGQPYMFARDYGATLFADADHIGELQAWNVDTGKRVWMTKMPKMSPNWGPVLSTAGSLLFSGGTNDQLFRAFDSMTGKVLWTHQLPSGVTGVPTSYSIKGKQHIAVQAGWGGGAAAMQSALNKLAPGRFPQVPQGGSIWVFALE
jgi:alcohol dehydrogenase (cytochrome c)